MNGAPFILIKIDAFNDIRIIYSIFFRWTCSANGDEEIVFLDEEELKNALRAAPRWKIEGEIVCMSPADGIAQKIRF